ncbi:tumor necrosis factor receptor superfamily member 5-like isoform X2 [Hoplias malabaricus]|uniref:tumor necrosis factor receptor superfamily member 5-like isoform X2 n=1 Tax=Hoplias malabaricus TaxID=27720 RepID=UPI003461DF93
MCPIGMVLLRDCVGDNSTVCKPCPEGTFMNEPNCLEKCFSCKTCSKEQGLYFSRPCSTISNAVCEVMDGYHCADFSEMECTIAVNHTKCHEGQEIKTPGTKTSDTVCHPCPEGFYSPLGVNCTRWTNCSIRDEVMEKEGNSVKDVQCKPTSRRRDSLIATAVLFFFFLFFCLSFLFKKYIGQSDKKNHQKKYGNHSNGLSAVTHPGLGANP